MATRYNVMSLHAVILLAIQLVILPQAHALNSEPNESGFGIEFWTKVINESQYTFGNITFAGSGDQPLTETQTIDVEVNLDDDWYDVCLFYRYKRCKIGWIPTSLTHCDNYHGDAAHYNQPFGPWPLGKYSLSTDMVNLGYLEVTGWKGRTAEASIALRFDKIDIQGEMQTIKYPFGAEWYQTPIILNSQPIDTSFYTLSLGPKLQIGANPKEIDALDSTPLKYFSKVGLDFSVLFNVPIDDSNYGGYTANVSLALMY